MTPDRSPKSHQLLQRFDVLKVLSQSADAQTYHVLDTESQQERVIKRLQLGKINAWKRLELFEREARVLAALNHPRIPRLVDFYREETQEGLNAYLISDWIQGESLAHKISQHWLPDEPTLLRLAEQLLWILEYLHAFQPAVIHRDIKPSNLILTAKGQLYLIDFGGAQELLQPMGGGGSTVIGTFGYMAPEQFAGRAVPATDLYGMGTSLIHLLSGRAPVNIPQRNMQLTFQGLVQGSGGLLRWLTQMIRPGTEDRFASAAIARKQLYAMTELLPAQAPMIAAAPILSESLRHLLTRTETQFEAHPAEALLQIGDQIEGYQITAILTRGSHSVSYLALAPERQTEVFLKAIHFQSQQVWKGLTLFEREIETLQRMDHPGIPKYIDTFKTHQQDFYLVTEKIEGQNLEQKLDSGWRPLEPEVVALALQALDILAYMHQQKPVIIHRDLKPSNFLIDPAGRLYLIDFGGVQNHFQMQGTGGSTVIGTYGYIAPEEFLKKAVPATDLYSLGITLVRLLSGHEPTAIPQQDLRLKFRPLLNCSEPLKDWLETLTEPDIHQRFRSAVQAKALLLPHHEHLLTRQNLPRRPAPTTETSTAKQAEIFKPLLKTSEQDIQAILNLKAASLVESPLEPVPVPSQTPAVYRLMLNLESEVLGLNLHFKSHSKPFESIKKHTLKCSLAESTDLVQFAKQQKIHLVNAELIKIRAFLSTQAFTKKKVFVFVRALMIFNLLMFVPLIQQLFPGFFIANMIFVVIYANAYHTLFGDSDFTANIKHRFRWHHYLKLKLNQYKNQAAVSFYLSKTDVFLINSERKCTFECLRTQLGQRTIYILDISHQNGEIVHHDLVPFSDFAEAQTMAQQLNALQNRMQVEDSSEF